MNFFNEPNNSLTKIIALDPGDVWTGTAISDALGFTAKPFETIKTENLTSWLTKQLSSQSYKEIVIGYPLTLRGTQSEQTKKVLALKKTLEEQFPSITFRLWDERLTSKQADTIKHAKTKEEKIAAHSVAAAFILQSYLDYLHFQKEI